MKLTDKKFTAAKSNNKEVKYSVRDVKAALGAGSDSLFDRIASEVFEPELGKPAEPPQKKEKQPKYPGMWSKSKIGNFFRKLRSGGMTDREEAVKAAIRDGASGRGGEDDPRVVAFLKAMWDRSVSVTAYRDLYAGLSADSLSAEEREGTTVEAQMMPGMPPMGPPGAPGGAPGGMPMEMPPMGGPGMPPPGADAGGPDMDGDEEVEDPGSLGNKLKEIEELAGKAQKQIEKSDPPSETGSIPAPAPKVMSASIYRKIAGPGDKDEESPADLNQDSPDDEAPAEIEKGTGWVGDPDSAHGSQKVPTVSQPGLPDDITKKVVRPSVVTPKKEVDPILIDIDNKLKRVRSMGRQDLIEKLLKLRKEHLSRPEYDSDVSEEDSSGDQELGVVHMQDPAGATSGKSTFTRYTTQMSREEIVSEIAALKEKIKADDEERSVRLPEIKSQMDAAAARLNAASPEEHFDLKKQVDSLGAQYSHYMGSGTADRNRLSELEQRLKDDPVVKVQEEIESAKAAGDTDLAERLEKKLRIITRNRQAPAENGIKINTDEFGYKAPDVRKRYVSEPKELPAKKVDQSKGVPYKTYPTGHEPLAAKTNADIRKEFDRLFPAYAQEKVNQGLDPIPMLEPHGPAWMRKKDDEQSSEWKPLTPEVEEKTRTLLKQEMDRLEKIPDNDNSPAAAAARSNILSNLKSLRYVLNGDVGKLAMETDAQIKSGVIARDIMINMDELQSGKKLVKVEGKDGTPSQWTYVDLTDEDKKRLQSKIDSLTTEQREYDMLGGADNPFRRQVILDAKSEMHGLKIRYGEVAKEIGRLSKSTLPSDKDKLKSLEDERQYLDNSINVREQIVGPVLKDEDRKEKIEVAEAKLKDARRYLREHAGLINSIHKEYDDAYNALEDAKMHESLIGDSRNVAKQLEKARASGDTKLVNELQTRLKNYKFDPQEVDDRIKGLHKDLKLAEDKLSAEAKKTSMFEEQVAAAELERKTLVGDVTVLSDPKLLVKMYDEPHYAKFAAGVGSEVKNLLYAGPLTDSSLKHRIKPGDEEKLPGGRLHGALEQAHVFAYNHIQAPLDAERAKHAVAMDHTSKLLHRQTEAVAKALADIGTSENELTKEVLDTSVKLSDTQTSTIRDLIKTRDLTAREYRKQKKVMHSSDKSELVDALARHMTTGAGMRVPFRVPGSNEVITADDIGNGVAKHALDSWMTFCLFSRLIKMDYNHASTGDVKYKDQRGPAGKDWNILPDDGSEYQGDTSVVEYQNMEKEFNRLVQRQQALKLAPKVYENKVKELEAEGTTIDKKIADYNEKLAKAQNLLALAKSDADKQRVSGIIESISNEVSGLETIVKNKEELETSSARANEIRQRALGKSPEGTDDGYYKYRQERRSDPELLNGMNADSANPSDSAQLKQDRYVQSPTFSRPKDMHGRNLGQQYIEASTPVQPQQWDNGVRRNIEIGFGLGGGPPKLIDVLLADSLQPGGKPKMILVDGVEVEAPSLSSYGKLINEIGHRTVTFSKFISDGIIEMKPLRKSELQPVVDPVTGNPVIGRDGKPKMDIVVLKEYLRDENGNVVFAPATDSMQIMNEGNVGPKQLGLMKAFNEILWHAWAHNRNMVLKGARNNKSSADKTTSPAGRPVKPRKLGPGLKPKTDEQEREIADSKKKKPGKPVVTAPTVSVPSNIKIRPVMVPPIKKKSESDKVAVDDEAKSYYKKMFPGQYGKQMGDDVKTKKKVKKKSDRLANVVDSVESVFSEYGISDNARIAAVAEFVADDAQTPKYAVFETLADNDVQFGKSFYKLIANHVVKHNMDKPFGGRIPASVKGAVISAALSESGLEDKIMKYVAQKMKMPKVRTKSEDAVDVDAPKDEAKKSKPANRSYGIEFKVDDMFKRGYYTHMVISWDPDEDDAKKSTDGLKQAVRSYVKGLESAKEFHNIGFLGQIEFKELDEEAGMAEVYFKTRVDGDSIPVYRDIPKSKDK